MTTINQHPIILLIIKIVYWIFIISTRSLSKTSKLPLNSFVQTPSWRLSKLKIRSRSLVLG